MLKKRKAKKVKGFHNLSAGLFGYKGKYWWENIGDIRTFISRINFTLRHGYSPQALWETDSWFIDIMREILINYRDNRIFVGFFEEATNTDEDNASKTNDLLNHMLELLDKMNFDFTDDENVADESEAAKDEFFALFSKYFHYFWE